MALEKKLIGIPLAKGINDKIHDRVLPAGEMTLITNGHFYKAGELRKRKGFHSISNDIPAIDTGDSARTIDTGKALAAYNDEILAFDGRSAYSKTSTSDHWVNKGTVVGSTLETELVEAGTNIVQTSAQIGQANGFEVHAWSEIDPTENVTMAATFSSVSAVVNAVPGATMSCISGGGSCGQAPTVNPLTWFTGTDNDRAYKVTIASEGTPDTWNWEYDENNDGSYVSGGTGIAAGPDTTLNHGVGIEFVGTTGHTKDDVFRFLAVNGTKLTLNGLVSGHQFAIGQQVVIDFTSGSWPDGTYLVTALPSSTSMTIDLTVPVPLNPSGTPTGGTIANVGDSGVVWRSYAKVIDKETRTEIVGRTLFSTLTTANAFYNVPRVQVAVSGQYVFLFAYVGNGRVKYAKVDTGGGSGAIANALIPALLTSGAGELFQVDLTNPVWAVEAVNNASISNGICVLARVDYSITSPSPSDRYLRLSYYENSGGTLSEASSPAPTTAAFESRVHFPLANTVGAPSSSATSEYIGAANKGNMELVGGIMLKVVTPSDRTTGDYIAVAYTASADATGGGAGGSTDEPAGVKYRVYNAALVLQGSEQNATLNTVTMAYQSTSLPGFILVNGTAGKNVSGKVRFFFTVVANKTNLLARSPEFLVNAYDYTLSGGGADVDLDLYGMTITSDCFAHNRDLYLGVGHATRPNNVSGDAMLAHSVFNTSVGLIMNHQGEVIAKTAISAGPWTQEIDFRFMQYMVFNRCHLMHGVSRVHAESSTDVLSGSIDPIASTTVTGVNTRFTSQLAVGDIITVTGESRSVSAIASDTSLTVSEAFSDNANDTSPEKYVATKYRFGTSRYSGVNLNSDGLDLTAMDAAVGILDFAPTRYLPSVQANGALKVAGGILWDYSGDYFKEDNFFYYPEIHSMSLATVADTLDDTYSYVAIYEWVDHNGKVQQSNPSLPITTGDLNNNVVTVNVYTLLMTYKRDATTLVNPGGFSFVSAGARSEVKIVLYRTTNTATGGSIFHRCAEALMDRSSRIQSIEDSLSDTDLIDNPVLYTTGGVAGNIAPPSQYDIAVWKDRVFLATTENTVWFSKRFVEGQETGFSESFIRSVDNRAEKIRAICPNLEHMLILGARNGYYMSGDGPSSTGAGPGFSPLRRFAPGQGALDGCCRVETPVGVFFQTRQGLMLCDRSMKVSFKGAKVADSYVSTNNYMIDGHVLEDTHEVRFTGYGTGGILVYNYLFDQFAAWDLHADLKVNAASLMVEGEHYRLGVNGILCKQHPTVTYDKLVSVDKGYAYGFITGWFNVGELQQLGRVYRLLFLGDYNASSNPQLLLYTDYNESPTLVEMDAAPGTSKFQLVAKLPKQKVKALKFGITETTESTGGDFRIQGVSMLVGVKKPENSFKFPTTDMIS